MIPEFLKMENKPIKRTKTDIAISKYKKHFGVQPTNEPSEWTDDEFEQIVDYCISENIRIEEVLKIEDAPDLDY